MDEGEENAEIDSLDIIIESAGSASVRGFDSDWCLGYTLGSTRSKLKQH